MSIHFIKLGPEEIPVRGNCHRIVQDGANPLQINSNYEGDTGTDWFLSREVQSLRNRVQGFVSPHTNFMYALACSNILKFYIDFTRCLQVMRRRRRSGKGLIADVAKGAGVVDQT